MPAPGLFSPTGFGGSMKKKHVHKMGEMGTPVPELLAPAGSVEAFTIAVAAGADAVYLGGRKFGARHFAANFDDETLSDAVAYAHLRGVRVYVTVNTLIHDTEIPSVLEYIRYLSSIGTDAIILQDIGLFSLCFRMFTDIEGMPRIHASTQMLIHNREGACWIAEHGCGRIVLARELPADEVRVIAEAVRRYKTGVEIFAHGALCYAYSGQCLLSAVIGGRSGNRGMCAQPCRKPYQLLTGEADQYGRLINARTVSVGGDYLLSTRDLSIYPTLTMLADLPVSSLKIEGRMRSPEYVGTVTAIYRRALDHLRSGGFTPDPDDETNLFLAFSRGFTTGYLNNEGFTTVMGRDLPGKRGILIGTVESPGAHGSIRFTSIHPVVPRKGDGMVCTGRGRETGFMIRQNPVPDGKKIRLELPDSCAPGDTVFLTSRGELARTTSMILQRPDERFLGSILLDIILEILPGGEVNIQGRGRTRTLRSFSFSFRSESAFSPARSQPLSPDLIEAALRKTGGTLFRFQEITIISPGAFFVPHSILNSLRREILEKAGEEIKRIHQPTPPALTHLTERISLLFGSNTMKKETAREDAGSIGLVVLLSEPAALIPTLEAGADRVYLEWFPRQGPDTTIQDICRVSSGYPGYRDRIGIKLPRILRGAEISALKKQLTSLVTAGISRWMTDGPGIGEMLKSYHDHFNIAGFSGLNITNHLSLDSLVGYEFLTLSPELSGEEIAITMQSARNAGCITPAAILCQGLLEAMITEDRIPDLIPPRVRGSVHGLRDSTGAIFPVFQDPSGRTHIMNAAETSLGDRIPDIIRAGIRYCIIDARFRSARYATSMTEAWNEALKPGITGWSPAGYAPVREKIREISWGELTAATWKRGLTRQTEGGSADSPRSRVKRPDRRG